jgi:hypothetical protein
MNSDERDPLFDKLRALPMHNMSSVRSAQTLRAAEEVFSGKVRPSISWPKFAIGAILSVAGAMYTVDSVHKLGDIYMFNRVATLDAER